MAISPRLSTSGIHPLSKLLNSNHFATWEKRLANPVGTVFWFVSLSIFEVSGACKSHPETPLRGLGLWFAT